MDAPNRVIVDEVGSMQPDAPTIPKPAPAADEDAAVKDGADKPAADKPAADTPAADKPTADTPAADKPTADKPAGSDGQEEKKEAVGGPSEGAGEEDEGERERPRVTITASDMELHQQPSDVAAALTEVDASERKRQEERYHECKLAKLAKVADLRNGEGLILKVLVGLGLLLVIGLAIYGIKMTHRVAGPLFKITLYLRKLRDGKYDTVYNLRKGDHLQDFYEHFKAAHEGATNFVKEDIERLKAILDAAEEAELAKKSPELESAIAELRDLLADRESSIG